jgi:MoaA/NifB/PqqE/SkfB family radical SAM enzyme
MLKLTNRCNLGNCRYCYTQARRENSSSKELDTKIYLDLIRHLVEDQEDGRLEELSLTGGEIFLRPDLSKIVSFALSNGISTRLNTSGTLINHANASSLSELASNYRTPIVFQVGLDSADKNIHEFIRGQGTFDKTYEGITQLVSAKNPFTRVSLRYTLMQKALMEGSKVFLKDVFEDARNYVELAERLNVERIKLRELLTSGYGINLQDFVLPADLIGELQGTFIESIKTKPNLDLEISWPFYFKGIIPTEVKDRVRIPPCRCLDKYVSVDANGGVVGCVLLMGHPEQYIGNILQEDIINIFNSPRACQMLFDRYSVGRGKGRCYAIDHSHEEQGIDVALRRKE